MYFLLLMWTIMLQMSQINSFIYGAWETGTLHDAFPRSSHREHKTGNKYQNFRVLISEKLVNLYYGLLECDAVNICKYIPTFRRYLPLSSPRYNIWAAGFFEILDKLRQTTRRHIPSSLLQSLMALNTFHRKTMNDFTGPDLGWSLSKLNVGTTEYRALLLPAIYWKKWNQ